MKEKFQDILNIVKEISLIEKLSSDEMDLNFNSSNVQERISVYENIKKLQFSLKNDLIFQMDYIKKYILSLPEDHLKFLNFLYIQKIFQSIQGNNQSDLIWKIGYLNGLSLGENKEIEITSTLNKKRELISIMVNPKMDYLSWYNLNDLYIYFDYNLNSLALSILRYVFITEYFKTVYLNENYIIEFVISKDDAKTTLEAMQDLINEMA